jgi:hypothetical protein
MPLLNDVIDEFVAALAIWFSGGVARFERSQYRTDLEHYEDFRYQLQALIVGSDRSDSNEPLDVAAFKILIYQKIDYVSDNPIPGEKLITQVQYPNSTRIIISPEFWLDVPSAFDVDFDGQDFSVSVQGAAVVLELNWLVRIVPEPIVRP